MAKYSANELETALGKLWDLVEDRLTDEEKKQLGVNLDNPEVISGVFDELNEFGSGGPAGIGLGRWGGHAVGE